MAGAAFLSFPSTELVDVFTSTLLLCTRSRTSAALIHSCVRTPELPGAVCVGILGWLTRVRSLEGAEGSGSLWHSVRFRRFPHVLALAGHALVDLPLCLAVHPSPLPCLPLYASFRKVSVVRERGAGRVLSVSRIPSQAVHGVVYIQMYATCVYARRYVRISTQVCLCMYVYMYVYRVHASLCLRGWVYRGVLTVLSMNPKTERGMSVRRKKEEERGRGACKLLWRFRNHACSKKERITTSCTHRDFPPRRVGGTRITRRRPSLFVSSILRSLRFSCFKKLQLSRE